MQILDVNTIRYNHQEVLERIEKAADIAGRDPAEIKLVVVSKSHPIHSVKNAIDAGVRIFGENYPEEGVEKVLACPSDIGIEWHMIGHVQSRKARLVSEHFSWVHSVDRLKLADRLDRFAAELGKILPVLLECNVSGEESKFGWPAWQEDRWEELLPQFEEVLLRTNLQVCGLMSIPPFFPDAESVRPYFQRLRRLKAFVQQHLPTAKWEELSMGMSADFEIAVQEGATYVRVGTAILGQRSYNF